MRILYHSTDGIHNYLEAPYLHPCPGKNHHNIALLTEVQRKDV